MSSPLSPAQANHTFQWPRGADILAGLSVAGILLPEAVAYATIAGLAPIHALIAGLIGLLVYTVIGSCRQAIVSPTSSAAAIFASAAVINVDMGFALVMVTGVLFVIAAWLKGGFIGSFISRPVMLGFAWSLALTIMLKQVPHLLGLDVHAQHFFPLLGQIIEHFNQVHLPSASLGLGCFITWLALKHLNRRWLPPSLVVLMGGTLVASWLHLADAGVKVVGWIPLTGLGLHLPQLQLGQWLQVIQLAPAMLLIIFAESWESVRLLAAHSNQPINANRELAALGGANLLCGAAGALPVGAGYSACNASLSAGATGRWAAVATAVALAGLLIFGRHALASLPIPVLAAVVTGILAHHFWPSELIQGTRLGGDAWVGWACVAAVLLFGVMFGMVASVGLSLILALYRFSKPLLSELGHIADSRDYVDIKQHPEAQRVADVLIVRPEEPLFFANAEQIFDQIRKLALDRQVHRVIISMEACDDLDATTLYALQNFITALHQAHISLWLARLKDRPRTALTRINLDAQHLQLDWSWSVADAVAASQRPLGT